MASLFGITFFSGSVSDLYTEFVHAVRIKRPITIATINPEILLRASRDEHFANALMHADFRVVDGFGISFVSFLKLRKSIRRITGRMVVDLLFRLAREENLRIGVIGGKKNTSARAATNLSSQYPGVHVTSVDRGPEIVVSDQGIVTQGNESAMRVIQDRSIDILLLGFGAPKQEYIMQQQSALFAPIRVGIGGLIDVYGGNLRQPPRFLTQIGLEWLYRFAQQPRRFTRIWNAVIVFTFKALITKQG